MPDRLAVVKGGPLVRRAYFDRMLGRLYPRSRELPSEYGRALAQRNEALRRARHGASSREAVAPWTERVAELGSRARRAPAASLVDALAPGFAARARCPRPRRRRARLRRASRSTVAELEDRLERDLARGDDGSRPAPARRRDRAPAARELRSFGSQGEQRTAVLALVLAEADLSPESAETPPLLLLDDVLSELDESRRRAAALEALPAGAQTIVTATAPGRPAARKRGAALALVVVTPGEARAA